MLEQLIAAIIFQAKKDWIVYKDKSKHEKLGTAQKRILDSAERFLFSKDTLEDFLCMYRLDISAEYIRKQVKKQYYSYAHIKQRKKKTYFKRKENY